MSLLYTELHIELSSQLCMQITTHFLNVSCVFMINNHLKVLTSDPETMTCDPIPPHQLIPHQSLGDIPSSGQRFEMSAVIDQLHLLQVQSLQNLLTGPVHHLQLFMAVYQEQGPTVYPL